MTNHTKNNISSEYRGLRFDSIDDCIAEVNRIIIALDAGSLNATGNWTPSEIMTHVANWIQYAYIGFPLKHPPFFVRWILRLRLRKMLRDGMPRGVRIPGVKDGTVGMQEIDTHEAGRQLLTALDRLKSDREARFNSPAFGAMSYEDRVRLNLRHAELHFGYLKY